MIPYVLPARKVTKGVHHKPILEQQTGIERGLIYR